MPVNKRPHPPLFFLGIFFPVKRTKKKTPGFLPSKRKGGFIGLLMRIQENNFSEGPRIISFFFEVFISMGGIPKMKQIASCLSSIILILLFAFHPGLRCGGGRYLLPALVVPVLPNRRRPE